MLKNEITLTKLITTTLVVISFTYFYIEGPLEEVAEHLRFDHELTEYAIPKFVNEQEDKHSSHGFVEEVEIDGFGHSLVLEHHQEQQAPFGLITKPKATQVNSEIISRLKKHSRKLYDKTYSFEVHDNADAPFIEIKKEDERYYYIETLEHTHDIRGYAGPINVGIVYDAEGTISSLLHIDSEETSSYLDKITKAGFYQHFEQLPLEEHQEIDGVSGATITTKAISENCTAMSEKLFPDLLGNYVDTASPFSFSVTTIFSNIWILHIIIITLIFFYGFQKKILKKSKTTTTIVRLTSIGYIGFYLNNSFTYTTLLHPFIGVSLSLLSGSYLFLALIGAIWGKNIYCKYVCPFGNAQCLASQYAGKKIKTKFFLSDKWVKLIRVLTALTLIVGIILGMDKWKNFEPFPDAFGRELVSFWFFIAAFIVLLAIRYPMLWCRSLCPTGWFLDGLSDISNNKISFFKWKRSILPKAASIVFIISSAYQVNAQSITILDEEELTMPYSHIIQYDSSDNKTHLTDLEGNLNLNSTKPTRVKILVLGYKTIDTLLYPNKSYSFKMKPEVQVLNEVVVTAQFSPNSPEKAVHQIKIIDQKRIEAQGANTLEDLLSNEANIRIEQDNILGSGLSLQGVSGQNVKILIDGVPMVGRLDGNIDLSQINLNNVKRIEIIEGPLSVNYGSNALAGTINIITKDSQKKKTEGTLNSYYETIGRYNLNSSFGIKKRKHFTNLSIGRNYFDGWSSTETERFYEWKPKRQLFGKGQYVRKDSNTTYRFASEVFNEKVYNLGTPRYIGSEVSAFDDYYYTTRFDNSVNINHYFSNNNHFDILAAFNHYERTKNRYNKDLISLDEQLTTGEGDQDTSQYHVAMSRGSYSTANDSSSINYQFGYDVNIEKAWGRRILNESQTIGDYALFTNAEWNITKKFILRPGVRYSYNTKYNAPITPSLNLKYNIKHSTFRVSYARGFRAPSVKDLYFNFVDSNHDIHGNENLKSEQSHNIQSSWKWEQKIKHKTQLKLGVNAFYNLIHNLIDLSQSTESNNYYQYVNIGEYKTFGTQLTIQLLFQHLKVTTNATTNAQTDNLASGDSIPPYVYSPEFRTNWMYEFHKHNITVSLFYKLNGKSYNYFVNPDNNEVERGFYNAYHMMDFTVSKAFWKNERLKLSLGAKNILNFTNVTRSGSNGVHSNGSDSSPQATGISFFTKLSLQL